ncbi:hypothetical protein LJB84_00010 [Bacteroidales bacterium OttesenSCG-928-J19]|nr:hypothetical protein [Bacteroidales bacterium OttesenSCG-928-J19]
MDNLSEIIPLLVVLGSIILSIVGGSKKKKPQDATNQPKMPSPQGEPDIPSFPFFEEIELPEAEKVVVQPVVKKTSIKKPVEAKVSSLTIPSNKFAEEESEPLFRFDDLDEVKKGIIYSEILNRKEY